MTSEFLGDSGRRSLEQHAFHGEYRAGRDLLHHEDGEQVAAGQ